MRSWLRAFSKARFRLVASAEVSRSTIAWTCSGYATAYSRAMNPPYEPPATTILSAPIHWRRPSTSAAHWACEYGGVASLWPQPPEAKTTTRDPADSRAKGDFG